MIRARKESNPNNAPGEQLLALLKELLKTLPEDPSTLGPLSKSKLGLLRESIRASIMRLQTLLRDLDPVKQPPYVFDPSDPQEVGRLIADTLLFEVRVPLSSIGRFYGSGVYAIYYNGPFEAYLPIRNKEIPIYVGKADPAVHQADSPEAQGMRLWNRLNDHQRSIRSTHNLLLEDFECRFLVVKSAWQNTAETYLIERFKPIWNNEVKICYGFGKHGDSAETRGNTRSPWDTMHPGRSWATGEENKRHPKSPEVIAKEILVHLNKQVALLAGKGEHESG